MAKEQCSKELIIGFDPSFISKSGKSTPGTGYFYSGCAGAYKYGMEIDSFAAIDVAQNTAYHLESVTSPSAKRDKLEGDKTMVDHYGSILVNRHEILEQISSTLVCDGYFAKKNMLMPYVTKPI